MRKTNNNKQMPSGGYKTQLVDDNASFIISEAYKNIRTNLMFMLSSKPGAKTFIVGSSVSGEGKSTTCLNIALSFVQMGCKVLVIDADMRKPKLASYLDIEADNGLSGVLGGFVKPGDVIVKNVRPGLDCLPAGHVPPNPAELLASDRMKELIDDMSDMYDYIIIDTPPISIVTDAVLIARHTMGVVMVVRENYTKRAMIDKSLEALRLSDVKLLGFLLNDSKNDLGIKYSDRKSGKYGYYE